MFFSVKGLLQGDWLIAIVYIMGSVFGKWFSMKHYDNYIDQCYMNFLNVLNNITNIFCLKKPITSYLFLNKKYTIFVINTGGVNIRRNQRSIAIYFILKKIINISSRLIIE